MKKKKCKRKLKLKSACIKIRGKSMHNDVYRIRKFSEKRSTVRMNEENLKYDRKNEKRLE